MGKMETLNPCKIETLEQIDTQFVRIDYTRGTIVPNLVKIGSRGTSGQRSEKNFLCDFIYFFSDQRREETPGRILMRNGSKDVESRKDVPFWGYEMKN